MRATTFQPIPHTTPPVTTLDSGPAAETGSTSTSFAFSSNEPATFRCELDGEALTPCSSPLELQALAVGPHVLSVQAVDPPKLVISFGQ